MCGRATFTTVASRLAIALAPTVAISAMRPVGERRTSSLATSPDAVSIRSLLPTTWRSGQRDEERRARRAHKAKLRRAYRLRERTKAAEKRASEPTPEPAHAPEHGPGRAKVRQGIVVSDKADKTIIVRVDVTRRHRRYGKIMRTSSKIHAHDERNDAGTGDTVRVIECRPMSRTKRWRLTDVLEKAK